MNAEPKKRYSTSEVFFVHSVARRQMEFCVPEVLPESVAARRRAVPPEGIRIVQFASYRWFSCDGRRGQAGTKDRANGWVWEEKTRMKENTEEDEEPSPGCLPVCPAAKQAEKPRSASRSEARPE